jgi:hypothetical protein
MIEDILGNPATHAAWSPYFNPEGNFVESVKVGEGFFEADSDGELSGRILQYSRVTDYDSGDVCLAPIGEAPPAPPPEVLEAARYEAEQQKLQS